MKDSKMSVDYLSSTIVGRGMEIEELEEKNRKYLELIKYLIISPNYLNMSFTTRDSMRKIRENSGNGPHDLRSAERALTDIAEMLTEGD